jgi:cytochrome c oxidase accessory protein FixG
MVVAMAGLLYFNFAWFREQFCVVLCPYGRLQSVLLDADSLVIGYDEARGEPRGKAKDPNRGDCVDCNRCVVVCPTGIDIRAGLQMDCVACAQCVDACDEVMAKLGQARGLIRYDSLNGLAGRAKRIVRPRLLIYTALGALGLVVAALSFRGRAAFEANVLRVQGAPYVLEAASVRNAYRVHLVNKTGSAATFHLAPEGPEGMVFTVPLSDVRLDSLESAEAPIFATVPRDKYKGPTTVRVIVHASDGETRILTVPFLGPLAKVASYGASP